MIPRVKVCCIASVEEAEEAIAAGAAALGLVSAMPSGPGVISDECAAEVAAAVRARHGAAIQTFLLTARRSAEAIAEQHARVGSSTLQLVDAVAPAELGRLRRLCPGVELVQVVHVLGDESIAEALALAPLVDAVLLDSGNPKLAVKQLGGTGRMHDWATSRRIRDALQLLQRPLPLPLWLAGGLNAANVAQGVRQVQPTGLDLCSGVRTEGRLDAAKLAAFMAAVRGASLPAGAPP